MGPDEMSNKVGNPVLAGYRVPAHLPRRFHQICLGAVAEVIGPTGITPSEYAVLVSIVDLPGLHQTSTCDMPRY
jgi:hypothetical protein